MRMLSMALMAAWITASAWNGIVFAESGIAIIESTQPGTGIKGKVTLTETEEGLKVQAQFDSAPAGQHGFHIHQYGTCGNEGSDAGGHYNPTEAPHGYLPEGGLHSAHAGDLGNIEIGEDGTGTLDVTLPELSLTGKEYPVAGRSVVLHAEADKFTQPAGDAGGRIGCGTIALTKDEA